MNTYTNLYERGVPQRSWIWAKRTVVSAVIYQSENGRQPHLNSRLVLWEGTRHEFDDRSRKARAVAYEQAERDLESALGLPDPA